MRFRQYWLQRYAEVFALINQKCILLFELQYFVIISDLQFFFYTSDDLTNICNEHQVN